MTIEETVDAEAIAHGPQIGGARLLARAALGSFGLSIVNIAATILTTILLARIMGVLEFGTFSFVVATVTLLSVPAILGFDRLFIRDIAVYTGRGLHGLARGLIARATQLVVGISVVLALSAAAAAWIVTGGAVSMSLAAFWVGAAALPFLALGRVVQGGLMGLHHVALGQAPEYLLRPVVFLLLVLAFYSLSGVALDGTVAVLLHGLSLALACVVSVALLVQRMPRDVRRARPVYETRRWVATAVSLGFLSGATVVNGQLGVALLGAVVGPDAAGLYAVAQRGALLVVIPLAAVNAAIAPTSARLWALGERERLQRLVTLGSRGLLVASLPIALGFVLFGRDILVFLFGPDFAAADVPLAILAIGQLANAATGTVATLLVMTGNQKWASLGVVGGAALNVALAALLIPGLGTAGAALAATSGIVLSNLVMAATTYRQLGIHSTALGRIGVSRKP